MGRAFIGLMSGTSLDGIDGVVVDFSDSRATAPSIRVLAHEHRDFGASLRGELQSLNRSGADEIHRAALAGNALARDYAAVIESLLERSAMAAPGDVVAIGCHGQTVRHRPGEFDGTGYTDFQLNAPALLAELTRIDVIADFRSRGMWPRAARVRRWCRRFIARSSAAAPIAPSPSMNLGGIANLSLLARDGTTTGFDCGPADTLLDLWCRRTTGQPFDRDGAMAARGSVDARLLDALRAESFFALPPPKSTGLDRFNADWLDPRLARVRAQPRLRPEDVQATLAELTARVCADACRTYADDAVELIVCGGGAFNADLMARLARTMTPTPVVASSERGLPPDHVEAAAFAWLARAFVERMPGNIAPVTGATGPRLLGALYPRRLRRRRTMKKAASRRLLQVDRLRQAKLEPQPQVGGRVRVLDHELRALQVVLVVDLGAAARYCRLIASMSRVTPFLLIDVSSSLTISSKVKPYWKPEQPPPCTNTRSLRSGLPSSSTSSFTLFAALSVKTNGGGGASASGELMMLSATALMRRSWKARTPIIDEPAGVRVVRISADVAGPCK